jgi:hypothetical protein
LEERTIFTKKLRSIFYSMKFALTFYRIYRVQPFHLSILIARAGVVCRKDSACGRIFKRYMPRVFGPRSINFPFRPEMATFTLVDFIKYSGIDIPNGSSAIYLHYVLLLQHPWVQMMRSSSLERWLAKYIGNKFNSDGNVTFEHFLELVDDKLFIMTCRSFPYPHP